MSAVVIASERPDSPDARSLIAELESELEPLYPAESRYGFAVEKMIATGVAFFVLREGGVPAACGGFQVLDGYAELKRMFVRPAFRGKGYAVAMLERLSAEVRKRGLTVLRLETGMHQTAAIALYEKEGFKRVPRFGAYRDDPLSRFFEKTL